MPADEILYLLEDVEPVSYCRADARCPIGDHRLIVQWDSSGHTMIHCDHCAQVDVLVALGLDISALTPPGQKAKRWPRRWWAMPPRYPSGTTPMGET